MSTENDLAALHLPHRAIHLHAAIKPTGHLLWKGFEQSKLLHYTPLVFTRTYKAEVNKAESLCGLFTTTDARTRPQKKAGSCEYTVE